MTAVTAIVRKQVVESKWLLGITAVALFLLCWLFVFITNRMENRSRMQGGDQFARAPRAMMARALGGPSADDSSTSLEIAWWRHPFIILMLAMWPIARGSAAVAGELEKGSLDMVLSRPISRSGYLTGQMIAALLGMLVLAAALFLGNRVGNHFNFIESPPRLVSVFRAGLVVIAFGVAVFGYTIALSSIDIVRWRPNLAASVITLAMFIVPIIATIPALEKYRWMEKYSIFYYYDPVEAALKANHLGFNLGILCGVGLVGIVLSYIAFNRRDLPANA
jgi:ABC-2 type transport system permease protein